MHGITIEFQWIQRGLIEKCVRKWGFVPGPGTTTWIDGNRFQVVRSEYNVDEQTAKVSLRL